MRRCTSRFLKQIRCANVHDGLRLSDGFVDALVISMMTTDLTGELNQSIRKATVIVTGFEALPLCLPLFLVKYMSDTYVEYLPISCATTKMGGLVMLSFVTSLQEPIKSILLYVALTLVAFGEAGCKVAELVGQTCDDRHHLHMTKEHLEQNKKNWPLMLAYSWKRRWIFQLLVVNVSSWKKCFKKLVIFMFFTVLFSYLASMGLRWRCVISAIIIGLSMFLFGLKRKPKRTDDDLTRTVIPMSQFMYYKLLNTITGVKDSSSSSMGTDSSEGKLEPNCFKLMLMMSPLWLTFVVYGMIEASGNSFFIDQASDLYLNSPMFLFSIIKPVAKTIASYLFDHIFADAQVSLILLVKMWVGIVCSVLCSISAWQVEVRRRSRSGGIQSPCWMLPQLMLWGFMEGLAANGLNEFSKQVHAMVYFDQTIGSQFNNWVMAIGKILNMLCILFFCSSWFGESLETSRLDLYYKLFAMVGFYNLVVFCFVVIVYGGYIYSFVGGQGMPSHIAGGEDETETTSQQPQIIEIITTHQLGLQPSHTFAFRSNTISNRQLDYLRTKSL